MQSVISLRGCEATLADSQSCLCGVHFAELLVLLLRCIRRSLQRSRHTVHETVDRLLLKRGRIKASETELYIAHTVLV